MSISGAQTICSGGSVTLTATSISGNNVTYTWSTTNGAGVANGNTYSATTASTYNVSVVDDNGCTWTDSHTLNAGSTPDVVLPASATYCGNNSVTLSGTVTAGSYSGNLTYSWKKDGVVIGGATGISYSATAAGVYTLIATDGNQCAGSDDITVSAGTEPNLTSVSGVNLCPAPSTTGTSTTLSAVLSGAANGTFAYQWKNSAGNIAGATSSTYTTSTAGAYTLRTTNTSNQCYTEVSKTV